MRITVFTSNQPRHINLINFISEIADETYAVLESNTLFPGLVQDFYNASPTMQEYMNGVRSAETDLFGKSRFISPSVNVLVMKSGELNHLTQEQLKAALESELYIVFGSSFIKGWLVDFLIEKRALNVHMGLSPYYRGSSCNFWALYDSLPNYVGATVHFLSKGLDSGPVIFHSVPEFKGEDPFAFTMKAVKKVQEDLIHYIKSVKMAETIPMIQNKALEIRYTRKSDFTDQVAREFLNRKLTRQNLEVLISNSQKPNLLSIE
jgi:folate-dependent phosphoribosylglycinamide formyltransferase PurN